ncbi:MAG: hypothetical protein A3G52_02985 [Candidatus Taylorbacteria bacterium RIFCSPLOWO2_12_FULL_43_20]|uniref:Lipid II flippase MurJ n=1 Tax=Candidatus Taylorbacteria bacterium RIFCSPLOWO2_12_FULL_43_20 TaxID=1802332 RepID=A0A1G2P330_9BACT|nr:MAG: hypothetical protein A2825_03860 [Candidatus Taylorbacteria bacterium RIFCSPHIGHO2_01_FULL_43_120]OHA22081.1 MAG: hypothetical protein A3B98_04245 [Candidatus Taylorbacteria bacterium RIFCSPHIGHO2_02_FULL_43_55]OHA28174.1 MAG: hypothetical protein A3E92_02125 [Candidatus Taylorbacteria bacterium RIFCSPHIGHO2_12_FULL_42_34]OHA31054.1 MAG: hypothetical protein A3B09_04190 [Candidatus Taylorbacteria bacterium RIFCSPLOWO2_01_FULL_43_83]OHA39710.1 MAG: hypothetical protein A3H58_04610 [Candi
MVGRILKLLNREIHGLHEAAFLLAFFAFSSQLLALVRDRLLAHEFGAGVSLDIYYAAFRIPDFIFITIGSLVSVSVLVPFLIEKIDKTDDKGARFTNSIFTVFFGFIVLSSVLAFLLMPYLVKLVFPGITRPELVAELVSLSRILLLSPIFLGLSNFFASIIQVYKRFLVYAVSPLLYNLGIIAGIVFFAPTYGIRGVVFGVILGAALHFALQFAAIFKDGMFPRFTFSINYRDIKRVVLLSFPRTVALSSTHLSLLFLFGFASLMKDGSIAIFNLAFNLQSVPLAIIGVSYSMAAFPTLSRLFGSGEIDKFMSHIISAVRHIIFWSLPVTALFITLRAQIVRTILGSGEFGWSDTKLTAAAFALFALSAIAQSVSLILVRGYYSASKTVRPLFINLVSSAITVGVTIFLIKAHAASGAFQETFDAVMRVGGLQGSIVLMLPLGFAVGTIINAVILWIYFETDFRSMRYAVSKTFFDSLSASVAIGGISYLSLKVFDNLFNVNTLLGIFAQGFMAGMMGIASGIIVLKMLKNQEIMDIWKTVRKRVWKSEIIQPETQV